MAAPSATGEQPACRLCNPGGAVHNFSLPGLTPIGEGMASIADPRNRRWRQPLDQQLPATARWVATLPAEIQPLTLLQRLPRIANDLARVWHDDTDIAVASG